MSDKIVNIKKLPDEQFNSIIQTDWPRASTRKFNPGQKVTLTGIKGESLKSRYKNWLDKTVVVVGYKRSGSYRNTSEYKVYDPKTKKSRWVYSDVLDPL